LTSLGEAYGWKALRKVGVFLQVMGSGQAEKVGKRETTMNRERKRLKEALVLAPSNRNAFFGQVQNQ
jgi:hypothetical protein